MGVMDINSSYKFPFMLTVKQFPKQYVTFHATDIILYTQHYSILYELKQFWFFKTLSHDKIFKQLFQFCLLHFHHEDSPSLSFRFSSEILQLHAYVKTLHWFWESFLA